MSSQEILDDIDEIGSFAGRGAGTDAERRLSSRLAERLRVTGMDVSVEPIHSHPHSSAVHLLHCLLALAGGILAVYVPVAGFAVVLLAAASAYFDLNGRFYLLRSLTFRRASQNVYAVPHGPVPDDAERLVLCANVDAPRGGFRPDLAERALRPLARRIPWLSGSRAWFWAMAALLIPIGIRAAGVDGEWVSVLQLLPMLVLIIACFSLGDRALSPIQAGIDDNASGVAALLEAHRMLQLDPPGRLRVELLLLGSGAPGMEGMRAFLRRHRELVRSRTRFLALERVSSGRPRFLVAQGPAVSMPVDVRLVSACEAMAAGEGAEEAAIRDGGTSAAHVARVHRYPSIAITGSEPASVRHGTDDADPSNVERAASFAVGVTQLIDRDLGRAGGGAGTAASVTESAEPVAT